MTPDQLIDAAGWTLLHSIWQFAAIALLLSVAMKAIATGRCHTRYLMACAALLLMIAAIAGTFVWQNNAPRLTATSQELRFDDKEQSDTSSAPLESVAAAAVQNGVVPASAAGTPNYNEIPPAEAAPLRARIETLLAPWLAPIVALWMFGVSLLSLRLWANWLAVRRLRASGSEIENRVWTRALARIQKRLVVARPVALLQTSAAAVPMVIGWLKPVVLVPVELVTGLTTAEIEAILAHELAHIRRHDYLVNLLQNIAETLLFYHPAVWWVSRQIRQEREFCCDDIAARLCDGTAVYARALTKVETMRSLPPALGMAASGGSLLVRIGRLAGREPRQAVGASGAMTAVLVLSCALMLLVSGAGSSENPPEPAPLTDKATAPAGFRHMTARTVDDAGKPVANTRVYVCIWPDEDNKYKTSKENYFTDAEGNARVLVPDPPRLFRVWTQQDGYVPLFAQWWPEEQPDGDQIPEEFTFSLPNGTAIGGTVVDDTGKPIEGATVEVQLVVDYANGDPARLKRPVASIWLSEAPGPGENPCVTDIQGRWNLNNVPAGDDVKVRVKLTHADYINDTTWGGLQAEQQVGMESLRNATTKIVMHSGPRATGAVTDANGKPVAGAVVVWGDDPYEQTGNQEVRTDADGNYKLPPLVPGVYPITVVAEGWRPELSIVEIEEGMAPADFQLKGGNVLRVKFVDENGEPVPEVYVGIREWRGKQSLYNHRHPNVLDTKIPLQANKEGIYEWTWAPPDGVKYSFGKKGYQENESILIADGEEFVVEMVAEP